MSALACVLLFLVALGPGCGIGAIVVDGGDAPDDAAGDSSNDDGDLPPFPPAPLPALEPSNGLDDDGDGLVDEDAIAVQYPCAEPLRCTCATTHTRCGDVCAPLGVDPENCGVCGHACPSGGICRDGTCFCADYSQVSCRGVCTQVRGDTRNCGACGRVCFDGADCVEGRCLCAPGFVYDRGSCHANGGAGLYCREPCPPGYGCSGTQCLCLMCHSTCPDYANDPSNCGGCGVVCPAGTPCLSGRCGCAASRVACGRTCVDLRADPSHCGACGRVCDATQRCLDGACRIRQGTPASGERVGAGRVALRWPGARGVADVCADRMCARVLETATPEAGGARTSPLAAGTYFWRVRADGAGPSRPVPFRVDRRATARAGLLPPSPDLDGDGLGDVVVATERELRVYFGTVAPGSLREGPRHTFPWSRSNEPLSLADDWSGDGVGDLFFGAYEADVVWIDSAGAVASMTLTGWRQRTRPLLDVDGDASPDLAAVNPNTRVLYGTALEPAALEGFQGSPAAVAPVGDVNGDGVRDVAFAASTTADIVTLGGRPAFPRADVYLGGPGGLTRALRAPAPAPGGAFLMGVASAGDVNADGFADVLVDVGGANVVVYLGGADALVRHRTVITPPRTSLVAGAAGDVDGDGDGDLVVVPRGAGELWLYRGGPAGLARAPEVLRDPRWADVAEVGLPRDVNGDGLDDVVLAAPARGAVYVLRGDAARPLARVEALPAFAAPTPSLRAL